MFIIANIITMAVWFRCKAAAIKREVSTQLFILRTFCVSDVAAAIASMAKLVWQFSDRVPVMSPMHAILLANLVNLVGTAVPLCSHLSTVLDFLASVFLVEHSHPAQRVLLFASLRRAQVLFAVALLVCLAASVGFFFSTGFVYCVNAGSAYLLKNDYLRTSSYFVMVHTTAGMVLYLLFVPLTFILLIVYASKRRCAYFRGSPTSGAASDSVSYSRQQDDDVEEETAEPRVVIEQGPSVSLGSELADELRQLIFWQQVLYFILLTAYVVIAVADALFSPMQLSLLRYISTTILFGILYLAV